MPRGCLQFVIVVFPDHTHLLILEKFKEEENTLRLRNVTDELRREILVRRKSITDL